MGKTIAQKIIASHLVSGDMTPGSEVALRIDQTLTQDATGTMAYLEFETMGIPRVKTEMSIAYVDHNTLQCGFENSDDHRYLQTVTAKHGVYFSRPGNGICHQVHLERFGKPGKTLIGSDSHTPTGGGIGMLAFGAGGLDVAVAMGGGAYYITMPKMYKVNLTGKLRPYVTAKDVSLELLRILSVKGGVGAIIEWGGEGIATLSVPERGTITNMGTELGATTSIFPSDEVTRKFLAAQGREGDYVPLSSDPDAEYDKIIDIDLGTLEAHDRLSPQPGQRGGRGDAERREGRSGMHRLLHQFLPVRHAQGRRHAEGQDHSPLCQPVRVPRLPAGADHAQRLRRPVGHPRQRRAAAGMRLRPLHRHGLLAKLRRRFPENLQPELPGPFRHTGRAGVSGFPRNRRGLCPDGVHHRPDHH